MRSIWTSRAVPSALVVLAGCGSQPATSAISQGPLPEGYVAPASTDKLPLVDHPEYVNWSRFPVGTSIVRKKEVTNEFGTVHVTTTLRLAEKTADKLVVKSQVTVARSGESPVENPPQQFNFPAQFRLPAGMKLEQFALPSLTARHVGEETREACGKEYRSQVFTWDERNETGPMAIKLWRCDDIPGRMLRQEIHGHMHDSVEEIAEINQPTL
jgi:hypothetical protein